MHQKMFAKRLLAHIIMSVLLTLPLQASLIYASTYYVKPSSEIPVRRGQGTQYKIVAVLANGSAVELLEEQKDWALISLQNGKQGWILKRYLSDTPPLDKQVELLREEKQALQEKTGLAEGNVEELVTVNAQIEKDLSTCLTNLRVTKESYQTLQEDTVDVVQTKKNLEIANHTIDELNQELSTLQIENAVMKKNETVKWFLAGGGVLLIGWIIGKFTRRSGKKRSSLL